MPEAGEIRGSKSLGLKTKGKRIWVVCSRCGKGWWVPLSITKRATFTGLCLSCCNTMKNHPLRSGGRYVNNAGYVSILLQPGDFFYSMAREDGYVFEHRLVVAKALGRCLHLWEIVHHKGTKYPKGSKEDKADNRYPENLQLVSDDKHNQITILEAKITHLRRQNKQLRDENKKLRG